MCLILLVALVCHAPIGVAIVAQLCAADTSPLLLLWWMLCHCCCSISSSGYFAATALLQRMLCRRCCSGGCFAAVVASVSPIADALLLCTGWPTCGYFAASSSSADALPMCAFLVDTLSLPSSRWMLCQRGFISSVGRLCVDVFFPTGPIG